MGGVLRQARHGDAAVRAGIVLMHNARNRTRVL
jgi:hypothetical protein